MNDYPKSIWHYYSGAYQRGISVSLTRKGLLCAKIIGATNMCTGSNYTVLFMALPWKEVRTRLRNYGRARMKIRLRKVVWDAFLDPRCTTFSILNFIHIYDFRAVHLMVEEYGLDKNCEDAFTVAS